MPLRDVRVPLYNGFKEDQERELIVNGDIGGKITLTVREGNKEIKVTCYFDDLERAWQAVKRRW